MGKTYWTDEAASVLGQLDPRAQRAIRDRVSRLTEFPHMYQASEDPRFEGCRRFLVRPYYVVYYRVWGEQEDCFVIAIRDARAGA